MDWEALRDDYPTLSRTTYLNSCSLGALSTQARAAHATFLEQWTDLGASAWYEIWVGEIEAWRKDVARLIGASPKEVAWMPSVGQSLCTVASALDRRNRDGKGPEAKRRGALMAELEFPSTFAAMRARPDTPMRFVPSEDGVQVPVSDYEAQLQGKAGAATQIVVASRVFYTTGAIQDVQGIAAAARKAGAFSFVDDYQGTGQVDLDVHAQGMDALASGALKWLCGGQACAFLYVRQALIKDLEPTISGWWANAGMFDFKLDQFRLWDDARRFELGTVNVGSVFLARAAMRPHLKLGTKAIQRRIGHLTADLVERLEDAGHALRIHPDPKRRSGIVMVRRRDAKADVKKLAKKGFIVDSRPGCVRISPHFYNTEAENAAIVKALGRAEAA